MAPAPASSRAGAVCSAFISSAPGSSTAAVSEAPSGATSSGWISERWSTERAPHSSATGTERCVESCSTCARSGASCGARDRAHPRQVLVREGDGLDEDVERVDVALARQRLGLVHPCVRGRAGRHRVGEQAGQAHRLHDPACQLAPEPGGARLARAGEPVARLALERRRAVPQQLARQRLGLREHVLVGRLGQRPRRAGDAAAGARDLLVGDAGDLALVLLGAPAREREVRVAVDEARQHGAARRVDDHAGVARLEAGDPAAVEQHVARLERQLARAISSQVGQSVPRRPQHLGGAADRDAHGARIGIRTPSRSAASIASS